MDETQRETTVRPSGHRGYKLFLALFPEPDVAQQLGGRASELRLLHGLRSACLAPSRLHITLHTLGDFRTEVPQEIVDAALAAAATVDWPPVPITFDQVMSFMPNQGFVLRCDVHSSTAVLRLRQVLALALRHVGLRGARSDTPHMTLLYDPRLVARQPIAPLRWTATRFALVLSHIGLSHHQWLAQWPLVPRAR